MNECKRKKKSREIGEIIATGANTVETHQVGRMIRRTMRKLQLYIDRTVAVGV